MASRADYQEIMDFQEPPAMVPVVIRITALRVEADAANTDTPDFDCPLLPRTPRWSNKCQSAIQDIWDGQVR